MDVDIASDVHESANGGQSRQVETDRVESDGRSCRRRVLLCPGRLLYRDYLEISRGLEHLTTCGVIFNEKKLGDWAPHRTGLPTWTFKRLAKDTAAYGQTPLHRHYDSVLSVLLRDARSFYLAERLYGTGASATVFNHTIRIEKVVWNALGIFHETKAERLVFINTPHSVLWYVAKVAEAIGLETCFTQTSPLPWRTWVVRGTDRQELVSIEKDMQDGSAPSLDIVGFIDKNRASYSIAIPEYERVRQDRHKGGFFRLRFEIERLLGSRSVKMLTKRVYASVQKRSALRKYTSIQCRKLPAEKFAVLFLHYQPERTTLPEGYQYVQQWLAIRAINQALPEGWALVVKEHPSTFRHIFAPTVREAEFYNSIRELPFTQLSPLDVSPFELIDKSAAVVTLTGTVGMQALIRGKPVLILGAAQYRKLHGAFAVKSVAEMRDALRAIDHGFTSASDEKLKAYFSDVERNSFPKDARINSSYPAIQLAMTCDNSHSWNDIPST